MAARKRSEIITSEPHAPRHGDLVGAWRVLELVEGVPLYEWARTTGRRLTSRRVLQLLANLELAEALEAAAASTRKSLDEPLRPSRSVLPTEPTRFRGERGWWLRVAALLAAAVGLTALGALVLALHPPGEHVEPLLPYLATEEEVAQLFSADAGVAEQAVASVHEVPVAGFPSFTLARPMPKEPLPKQRRPPCEPRVERAIHGGCWVPVGDEKPPCGPKMYDYEGRCYLASYNAPRQPTSERP